MGSHQIIPLQDALKTDTIDGSYLTYDGNVRGSLEPGKLADLVMIDADLLNAPDEEPLTMGDWVVLTGVRGKGGVCAGRV